LAHAAVASVLPPSATITRPTMSRGSARTTPAIEASSSRVGMTTATVPGPAILEHIPFLRNRDVLQIHALAHVLVGEPVATSPGHALKAPAQAAARAGGGRMVGQQAGAERAIGRPVPDLAQRLLRGVAERIVLVAALGERRDAARQRAAVRRDVHHGPRPPAHRPGRAVVTVIMAFEAHARLGHGARGAERHAERARDRLGLFEIAGFIARHALVQRLVRPRMTDRVLLEKDQAL